MSYLVVIDPALRKPELDCFNNIAMSTELTATYHLPVIGGTASLPQTTLRPAGIIILGSGASVHNNNRWQRQLVSWLQPHFEAGVPTLGLCYGHQLLGHLLGGTVELLWDGQKVKGVRDTELLPSLLCPDGGVTPLVVSHREGLRACPPRCRIIAQSEAVKVDGFAHDELPLWGFQAHIEATQMFLSNNEIEVNDPEKAFVSGHRILGHFLKRVESGP